MITEVDLSGTVGAGEAARRLGISRTYLVRLVESGKLEAALTPIGRLFDLAEVERLAAARSGSVLASK